MIIEPGKFYRARNGYKIGPMDRIMDSAIFPWYGKHNEESFVFTFYGKYFSLNNMESEFDLISEWKEDNEIKNSEPKWLKWTSNSKIHSDAYVEIRQLYSTGTKYYKASDVYWYENMEYRIHFSPEIELAFGKAWLNVYKNENNQTWFSLYESIDEGKSSNRIAQILVPWKEGQFDNDI